MAIIVLSHGSRHPAAAGAVEELARATEELTGEVTRAAYLDFTAPTLADAALTLALAGETQATVVPLLFTEGYHARVDVPTVAAEASELTGVDLRVASVLGTGSDIAALLAARVHDPSAHLVIYSVGSSNAQANAAVERLAVRVGDLTGQSTSCIFATKAAGTPYGLAGVDAQCATHGSAEVLPLFVAPGLLLDLLEPRGVHRIGKTYDGGVPEPLGAALAPIVAARARGGALGVVHARHSGQGAPVRSPLRGHATSATVRN